MNKINKCILCSSDNFDIIGSLKTENGIVNVRRCKNCDHNYTEFRSESNDGTASINSTLTTSEYVEKLIKASNDENVNINELARNRLIYFKSVLKNENFKVLEVGCGAGGLGGGFIKAKFPNENYTGVELDQELSNVGISRGLNIINKDVMDMDLSEKFDIICFSQVLEHINNPTEFMQRISKLLRKDKTAIIYLDVPNHFSLAGIFSRLIRGYKHRLGSIQWPYHCSSYSKKSLTYLIQTSIPESKFTILIKSPSDKTFGQGGYYGIFHRIYFLLSALLNSKSMLIAIVKIDF